jgi:predicted  nucleic acid-binding Zn-ribbon protein
MALRNYKCESCEHEWKRIQQGTYSACPKCGLVNIAALPTEINTLTYEMKDKHQGKQLRKGQEQKMRKRMNDHHDRNEVAEKIDKHGMDDAQRHGWLKRMKKI